HDVNQYIVSQARTYILGVSSAKPDSVDVDKACSNLLAGKALVSLGLITEAWVNGSAGPGDIAASSGRQLRVRVKVRGPSWITADRLDLYANGEKVLTRSITHSRTAVVKMDEEFIIPAPQHDAWLVAIATGPGIRAPYWPVSRPYQPRRADWEPVMVGSTNPIYIDADGDGKFSSPMDYARDICGKAAGDPKRLIGLLAEYDQAVAVQAFAVCRQRGMDLTSSGMQEAIRQAQPYVVQAYKAYTLWLPTAK